MSCLHRAAQSSVAWSWSGTRCTTGFKLMRTPSTLAANVWRRRGLDVHFAKAVYRDLQTAMFVEGKVGF